MGNTTYNNLTKRYTKNSTFYYFKTRKVFSLPYNMLGKNAIHKVKSKMWSALGP